MRSRRDTSSLPNRHTLMLPSAVRRRRLHVPQKCSVIEVINPTWPLAPGTTHALEVSFGLSRSCTRWKVGKRFLMAPSISSYETSFVSFHWLPSKGMYSMKRTSTFLSTESCTKSATSSSFSPRVTTQLILTDRISPLSLAAIASSIESTTFWYPLRRVINVNFSGTSVSSEMLYASIPPDARAGSLRLRVMPLVVMPIVSTPIFLSSPIAATSSVMSFRTVGSPPVSLILVTPAATKRRVRRRISGVVSMLSSGERSTPSSGMQYWQRRLQRSVSEMRR
mmetsp:Transcript_38246/g.90407  ORF Transcript_38246/g.90407 Transcript_38246/m.90407 type:complete len:280 (-) Transcript_38246:105-944(-)